MKNFPRGWKPRKIRNPRVPVPPPGGPMNGPKDEYKRSRYRRTGRDLIDEALEELDEAPEPSDDYDETLEELDGAREPLDDHDDSWDEE